MSANRHPKPVVSQKRKAAEATTPSARILAAVIAEDRMMTLDERIAFIDDIRSRSKPTNEDSTELIRRDRDER